MLSRIAVAPRAVERRLRLVTILDACGQVGLDPIGGHAIHAVAYLTDALAPVWSLPVAEAQLLKRKFRPFFPALQADLDWLVGAGLVRVQRFSYELDQDGSGWRLNASYRLDLDRASQVLQTAERLEGLRTSVAFVREVAFAAASLGELGVSRVGDVDAAYASELVDLEGLLDLTGAHPNATASAAKRFADLVPATYRMSSAEQVHLYARHLRGRAA